ncbi:thiamine diphosphokinase [Amaricoccus macauensis]|uniref:thiamine diphosphokinase n=1 Tax=Amaricoccus macauensis TaxID=57001 RepID=UPI003C7E25E8
MSGPLIRAEGPVTLIGGGPVEDRDLTEARDIAPLLVAADGGLNHLRSKDVRPAAVIGDMDSVELDLVRESGVACHHIAEQDSTDLEKCLRNIAAPIMIGIGFMGGRVDHHLAAMNALLRFADRPVILLGGSDICFLCPDELSLDLSSETRVSLFPMAPATGRISHGLRWSVEGLVMRPDGRIGTSNMALGGPIRVGFDAPAVLVILPRRELGQAVSVLAGSAS